MIKTRSFYKDMGVRIKQRRVELNLTQEELADRAGMSISFIGHIERGEKTASLDSMVELCKALGLSLDYAVLGKKELLECDYGIYEDLRELMEKYSRA